MAYWASYMHPRSQDPAIQDQQDERYLWEPYAPGTSVGPREPQSLREKIAAGIHQQLYRLAAGKSGFMNISGISDIILHRMFVELDIYYHHDLKDAEGRMRPARQLIRGELARLLEKHRGRQILLLAHSMGAIIAYDVLAHTVPDIPIHTFLTFGAPLGFPVIMKKIRQEMGLSMDTDVPLPAPASITHKWLNFFDPDDVTCLNYNLRNVYRENIHKVRPFDEIACNNFECNGVKNPHKCYGYLRTAEVSRALYDFLVLENASLLRRIGWVFKRPVV